jgi:glycosyltransferase involved in cell wall biosynthesis
MPRLGGGDLARNRRRIVTLGSSRPTVTVGIPVFNGARFIRQAIESVLAQTFTDYELLISDNASVDSTAAICGEYAAHDSRIKFVQQEKNQGPFWNLKFVTEQATGRLLVWLAHDDALHRQFIEECVAYLDRNPRAVVVSGDFRIVDESDNQVDMEILQTIREDIPWVRRCGQFFQYPIFSNVFYAFYGMIRADACRTVLGRVKEPRYMSQIELPVLARLATMGEITSLPAVLRDYRRVSTSLYHSEVNSLSRKSIYMRSIIQTRHISRLIIDQVSVLLWSHFSLVRKLGVLFRVGTYYCVKLIEISFGRRRSRR